MIDQSLKRVRQVGLLQDKQSNSFDFGPTLGSFGTAGRIVIIFIMFFGQVGPLTLCFLLATRKPKRISYPSGTAYLG